MSNKKIKFEEIVGNPDQIEVLFNLLSGRDHRISHIDSIRFEEHKRFVNQHPYRAWFLVALENDFVGSFYVSHQNTLGINVEDSCVQDILGPIISFVEQRYEPLAAIPSVRCGRFAVNVAPTNKTMIKALEGMGSKLAQVTYFIP